MGLQMILSLASVVALISLVNSFGSTVTAAFGTVNQIFNYVLLPAIAIGGAVTSMVAQNIGAGKWDKVNRITWAGVGLNLILTGILVTLTLLFQKPLLTLFLSPMSDAFTMGRQIINSTLWSYLLFGATFSIPRIKRLEICCQSQVFINHFISSLKNLSLISANSFCACFALPSSSPDKAANRSLKYRSNCSRQTFFQ